MGTTTIQITDNQKQKLESLKTSEGQPIKDVVQLLIDNYNNNPEMTDSRVRELAREEITDMVTVEALE